jgi:hypothetical protein
LCFLDFFLESILPERYEFLEASNGGWCGRRFEIWWNSSGGCYPFLVDLLG